MLYRQIIKKISDEDDPLQALGLARDKLVQIIHRASNADFTQLFTQKLDMKIMDRDPYEDTRKWLLEQLVAIGCDSGEIVLYQFLRDTYPDGIDEPFTTFYENYVSRVRNPMTKNFASRALGAIGLKARMLRINFEGRKKSADDDARKNQGKRMRSFPHSPNDGCERYGNNSECERGYHYQTRVI